MVYAKSSQLAYEKEATDDISPRASMLGRTYMYVRLRLQRATEIPQSWTREASAKVYTKQIKLWMETLSSE